MAKKKTKQEPDLLKTVLKPDQVEPLQPIDRFDSIAQKLGAGVPVTQDDVLFLAQELKRTKDGLIAGNAALEAVKAKALEVGKRNFAASEILTLWLAMRGSSSLEVFQATQGLANRTVTFLNG